jgi:hypothetical protein
MMIFKLAIMVKIEWAVAVGSSDLLGISFRIASLPPAKPSNADNGERQPDYV